jgi:hypothetical protein
MARGTDPWKRLLVAPPEIVIKGVRMGVANRYLETTDWKSIQEAIAANASPPDGLMVLHCCPKQGNATTREKCGLRSSE